jgi:hypothetical protein
LFEGQRDLKRQQAAGNTLTAMARQGIFRYFPGVDNANATNSNPSVDRQGNPLNPVGATGPLSAIDLFGNCTFNGAPVANCRTYRDPLRTGINNSAYMQETLRRMPLPNEFTGGDGLNQATIRFTRRVQGFDFTNGNGPDVDRDQYNARIDHNFNSNNKLSVIVRRKRRGAMRLKLSSDPGRRIRRCCDQAPGRLHHYVYVDAFQYSLKTNCGPAAAARSISNFRLRIVLMRSARRR